MRKTLGKTFAVLCAISLAAIWAAPASAQTEIKEKPPMYSYGANWLIPRAQWGEMEKSAGANQPILDKAVGSGILIGYGDDIDVVHTADGATHDSWWSAMSMAGLLNVLEQFHSSGASTGSALSSATKHWDNIFVSRYYNYHPGSWKGIYTHGSVYKLKADAPNDAVAIIARNVVGPLMEKMLADGTIHEYEIDTEAVHTESPDEFWIFYIASSAEGLDKVSAALREAAKENPLRGPAFGSMVDYSAHRDYLMRGNATYK